MTSARAPDLLAGATASSRSRKMASASEASAFSTIPRRVAGTASRERGTPKLFLEQRLYRLATQGGVEDLNGVTHRDTIVAHPLEGRLYLQHAARVGRDDYLRPRV